MAHLSADAGVVLPPIRLQVVARNRPDATRVLGRLLGELASAPDVHRADALIVTPNDPSARLHALGCPTVGTLDKVDYAFDRVWSVSAWMRAFN